MKIPFLLFLGLMLQFAGELAGQELMHKASRLEEKNYSKGVSSVSIRGEKASVSVRGWNGSEVKVIFRPVSRNSDKRLAIADLNYIRYLAVQEGEKLVISNTFEGEMDKITSNLSIEIELMVPVSMPVQVTNLYGPVIMGNLATAKANVSFGSLSLNNISSSCQIEVRYTDIELQSISGKMELKAGKSDIRARGLGGESAIDCSYGKVELALAPNAQVVVRAYRTAISVEVHEPDQYSYRLEAKQGSIFLPQAQPIKNNMVDIQHPGVSGKLDLSTSYCDISIITK